MWIKRPLTRAFFIPCLNVETRAGGFFSFPDGYSAEAAGNARQSGAGLAWNTHVCNLVIRR
jgi:hypothetical protein